MGYSYWITYDSIHKGCVSYDTNLVQRGVYSIRFYFIYHIVSNIVDYFHLCTYTDSTRISSVHIINGSSLYLAYQLYMPYIPNLHEAHNILSISIILNMRTWLVTYLNMIPV